MLIYPCRIRYLPYHDFLIAKDAQGICIVLLGLSKGCLIGRKMKCGTDESVISFESNILEISKKNRIGVINKMESRCSPRLRTLAEVMTLRPEMSMGRGRGCSHGGSV